MSVKLLANSGMSTFLILSGICLQSCLPFREVSRIYSPDRTKLVLYYYKKEVVWAGGQEISLAVLHTTQDVKKAGKYSISTRNMDTVYWKDNNTVMVEENFAEYIRHGKSSFNDSVVTLNNVRLKILQRDPIDSNYLRNIIYREISPDNLYELISYTYQKPGKVKHLFNISVIKINDTIPKYGNFYISTSSCNPDINWENATTLIFKLPKNCFLPELYLKYYLVNNRPDIKFKIYSSVPGK